MPAVSIAAATELWISWASIALEHRDEARAARERDGGPPADNMELRAAMIAIVAAASALDGFATVVADSGVVPERSAPGRAVHVWEILRGNFDVNAYTQTWPHALKELWKLRSHGTEGGLVHPRTIAGEAAPFPPVVPAPARTTYTSERAMLETSLMVEILTTCSPAAVRAGLGDLRTRVEGFTITGYIDDLARRA